jgi:regulator of replication initiation timing
MEHEFIGAVILAVALTIFLSFIIEGLKRRNKKQEEEIESLESVVRYVARLHGKMKKDLEDAKKLQAENETLQAENRKLSSEKMRLAEERILSEKQKNEMLRMIDKRQASLSRYKKLLILSMSGKEIPTEYLGKIMEME